MKIFGWKSAGRAEPRPALARGTVFAGGDWPRSYEAQVRDAYLGNAVAQRAVRLVAEGVGGAPLTASEPALLALVGGRTSGQSLCETLAAHLLLHGNAYVQLLTDSTGRLAELFALRPERLSVEADAAGWPVAYRYRVGERSVRLLAEGPRPEVVHIKAFHPLDDHYGLGCLGAAAGAVAIHNAAARWAKALLDNAGRPMLLEGGLKWQALSLSPADMDFAGTKAAAAREIALAFGVPPMLLGLPGDSTYANYREANRALWRLSILPLAEAIFAPLAQGLRGWFADAAVAVDRNQVPALSDDRAALWNQVTAADFLSPEEKRALVGLS